MTTKHPLSATSSRQSFSTGGPLSIVGVCLDQDTRALLKILVDAIPLVRLRPGVDEFHAEDPEFVTEWIGDPAPDVCLVDFDRDHRSATLFAEKIHSLAPDTAIFAVSSQSQPDSILRAMRSGCSEYLIKPIDREQFLVAIARVGGRKKEKKKGQYNAEVLTFIGAKGGCGVTSLLTQLGALLAKSYSRKTLLVDFHADCGDAALYLGLANSRYHSFDLVESADRLDAELLQSFLIRHSSGLDLIPAPEGSDPARRLFPGAVSQTLDFLCQGYELILIDLPTGLNEQNLELIRATDQLYLVMVPEVSALRNVVRQFDFLTRHEIQKERIRVVVNRHHNRALLTDAQIEKAIGRKIFWKVPNQYPQVVKTIHAGDPLAQLSSSEVMRNLAGWAGTVGGRPGEGTKVKPPRGILGILGR